MDELRGFVGPSFLFGIYRDGDVNNVIVMSAVRENDQLTDPVVERRYIKCQENFRTVPIPSVLDNLFTVNHRQVSRSTYQMVVGAMPNHIITLKLKKSGKVIPYTTINGQDMVPLDGLHVKMKSNTLLPDVEHVRIVGTDGSVETITVTDEMKELVGARNIVQSLITGR